MKDEDFEEEIKKLVAERRNSQEKQTNKIENPVVYKPEPTHKKIKQYKTKKEKKHRNTVKPVVILICLILIVSVLALNSYFNLNHSYLQIISEKDTLEKQLTQKNNNSNNSKEQLEDIKIDFSHCNKSLEENNSILFSLKSGDNYNLHDPIKSEIIDFLKDYTENKTENIILDFKKMGIRCALVEIGFENNLSLNLIGFDTLDFGMIYITPYMKYLVNPEVGLYYYNCIVDQPYGPSTVEDEDKITEILIIW